ncbi:hypothetical protein [Burkholderia ubonensis]|uniref:hypothetical protein n=1 Tax=Burkholderia ubonensis TaxID=101571 RepID=UPI0012F70C26|nr:hypothetical protein [Burkholderia ubonensis]
MNLARGLRDDVPQALSGRWHARVALRQRARQPAEPDQRVAASRVELLPAIQPNVMRERIVDREQRPPAQT